VVAGSSVESIPQLVADWCGLAEKTLIALDSPLGWPAALGGSLARHQAGAAINADPDLLFRRETDRVVRRVLGKQPLDVGADRIARTAVAALRLLAEVAEKVDSAIPLAWEADVPPGVSAIEVYPAGTLTSRGITAAGYKKAGQRATREAILDHLRQELRLDIDSNLPLGDPDVLDAIVCVLAAKDFLRGDCIDPVDPASARKEGWIWVRRPA
jgi:hypothetical protein